MCSLGKGGRSNSNQTAMAARTAENQRQVAVANGTSAINNTFDSQFTPDFYNRERQSFVDYAQPQLDNQYALAGRNLTYNLARSGNLESSTRGEQFGQLQQQRDTAARGIADQGNSYANQTRDQVEAARSGLVNTLNSTGDAGAASNAAMSRAAALSAPPAFSPIGDLFSNITAGAAQSAQQARLQALGLAPQGGSGMFASLFSPSSSAVARY